MPGGSRTGTFRCGRARASSRRRTGRTGRAPRRGSPRVRHYRRELPSAATIVGCFECWQLPGNLRTRRLDSAILAPEQTIICRNSEMAALDEPTSCCDRKTVSAVVIVSPINPFLESGKASVPSREVSPEFCLLAISCRRGDGEAIRRLLQQLGRRV